MTNDNGARELICEVGRRLYAKGFAAANDGNITIRLGENRFLCTPTGVSKGYMKPDDLCIVDINGNQLAGIKKRTSEIFLHLAIYRERPDIQGVLHCHPPHATAFAVAREPIPKCVLPEVEVFLGEIPMAKYETPGGQAFADTILPFVHDSNVVVLASHGTVAFAKDLMTAYFNTEILDAYCKILLLARQLGPISYLNERHVGDLLAIKQRIGIDDPRLQMENCDLCGNSLFREGYSDYVPEPKAFAPPNTHSSCSGLSPRTKVTTTPPVTPATPATPAIPASPARGVSPAPMDLEPLVQMITSQVMAALGQKK